MGRPSGLATIDLVVFVVNMTMALLSGAVNLRVAVHHPFLATRRRFQWIGLLSLLYAAGYIAVLLGKVPVATWSSYFRGVSMLAWPMVWIWPAVADAMKWRRETELAGKLRESAKGIVHARRDG